MRTKLAQCPSRSPASYGNCYTNDFLDRVRQGQEAELPSWPDSGLVGPCACCGHPWAPCHQTPSAILTIPPRGTHSPWNKPNSIPREPWGLSLACVCGGGPLADASAFSNSFFTFRGLWADTAPVCGHCSLNETQGRGACNACQGWGLGSSLALERG